MKKKKWLMIIGVTIVLLSGCSRSGEQKLLPEGTTEQRIKSLSADITGVEVVAESLKITYYKHPIANAHNWVWSFFEDAKTVLSRLDEASKNTSYSQVVFMVKLPAQDNLGHEFDQLGMKVFYDMGKLKGANWQNMTTFDMMELPIDFEIKRLGLEYVAEYCKDGENAKYSKTFCLRAFGQNIPLRMNNDK